jgi:Co/Zn/Cd efflux system component
VSRRPNRDDIALVLASALALSLLALSVAVLWQTIVGPSTPLSENTTQVLLASFTGVIGLLGGYIGGRRGGPPDSGQDT